MMFEVLYHKISSIIPVTAEEFAYCQTLFVPKTIRKKQYLLQEGNVCKHQAFIGKGMLRSYRTDAKGAEQIFQFATEGWWMADLSSYITGEPSHFNIDALEDADVLLLSKPAWEDLLKAIPKFEHYFRILIQNNLIATQKRLLQSLNETAEEKYMAFVKTYPDCVQRVPQHMIASYLGLSRETVSRLRRSHVLSR